MTEETPHLFPYLHQPKHVETGDIVQIAEGHAWAYALAVVDEVKDWGIQAYVRTLPSRKDSAGDAWIRLEFSEFYVTGGKVQITEDES
jgi:hypothetical protein